MRIEGTCPDCGSTELYSHDGIAARGPHGPDLLPGLSGMLVSAKMRSVVCKTCGLIRFYASAEALKRVNKDNGWSPL